MTKPKARRQGLQPGRRYVPTSAVLLRYDVAESTLQRWINDPRIDFPSPIQVTPKGHNFYDEEELDEYDRRVAEEGRARRVARATKPAVRFTRGEKAKVPA